MDGLCGQARKKVPMGSILVFISKRRRLDGVTVLIGTLECDVNRVPVLGSDEVGGSVPVCNHPREGRGGAFLFFSFPFLL